MLSPIFFGNKYHVPPFFIIITDDAVFYWNGERISIKIGEQSQKSDVIRTTNQKLRCCKELYNGKYLVYKGQSFSH